MFLAMVALMDQYLSFIETTAIPNILADYHVTADQYSWWKALFLIPTLLIFLLNGLMDVIGRKKTLLILILFFGLGSLGIVAASPTFFWFMTFFTIITFATVSNMWAIPLSEEAPADRRAKLGSLVYLISMIPIQAAIPPLLIRLGVSWKWMYGVMFLFMIPVLVMWVFMKETKRYEVIREEHRLGKRKISIIGRGTVTRQDVKYILFSAVVWMCGLIVGMLLVWAGHFFRDLHGFSVDQWSLVLLGGLLAIMAGALLGGWMMDKVGRRKGLLVGSTGLGICMFLIGIVPLGVSVLMMILSGFFIGFSYVWLVVFIPEIFPTERRGVCMGWTTAVARVSYIVGPILAAVLLSVSPGMELFWIAAGILSWLPIPLVVLFHPYETKQQELETIEASR
jgi:MFS family permease